VNRRALILTALILAAFVARQQLGAIEPVQLRSNLEDFPQTLDDWTGKRQLDLDPAVLNILTPDAYINRIYHGPESMAGVYIGYYRSQGQRRSIHSPLNCLPGSGWQPMRTDRVALPTRGTAHRVIIQRGEDRQVVLYWYQSAKRVEGDEYRSKLHLVMDAFISRRNDAALVRIVVPIDPRLEKGETASELAAFKLAELVEPEVARMLFASMPTEERSS
jgi:EpsI family protein